MDDRGWPPGQALCRARGRPVELFLRRRCRCGSLRVRSAGCDSTARCVTIQGITPTPTPTLAPTPTPTVAATRGGPLCLTGDLLQAQTMIISCTPLHNIVKADLKHRPVVRSVRVRLRTLSFHGYARLRTLTPQPSARLCTLGLRDTRVDLLCNRAMVLCRNKSGARGLVVQGNCVLKQGPRSIPC